MGEEMTPSPHAGVGPFKVSLEPVVSGEERRALEDAPTVTQVGEVRPAFEDLGPLPSHYGSQTLYLVARDPHWLFTYWDLIPAADLALTQAVAPPFHLALFSVDGTRESIVKLDGPLRTFYIRAAHANATYYAELGYFSESGAWQPMMRSAPAETPPENLSQEVATDFANVPFHLSFQQLLEIVKGQNAAGVDSLVGALSQGQSLLREQAGSPAVLPDSQLEKWDVMAGLLSGLLDEKGAVSSGFPELLRQRLQELGQRQHGRELLMEPEWAAIWSGTSGGGVSESFGTRL